MNFIFKAECKILQNYCNNLQKNVFVQILIYVILLVKVVNKQEVIN